MTEPNRSLLSRRSFAKLTAIAAAELAVSSRLPAQTVSDSPGRNIKKSLKLGMIAEGKTFEEKLTVAKNASFHSVEPGTLYDRSAVEELRQASEKTGILVDAVVCDKHWSHPLSDPDPAKVKVCVDSMRLSLENAKDLGADMVLLVPAVVNEKVMYEHAYERSMRVIREEIVPMATAMKIVVGIENVWNNFLLSPLEFRRYIQEIDSPYVRAWFDVGNVVAFGYPAGWIRTLGELIARVDIKDFKGSPMAGGEFVPLRQGSVPWNGVMKAFDEIGYQGIFAAEVQGGKQDYLIEMVSKPMDLIIGEK
ncbi:MAG TPA: sugar phosphate isomerase/epimerase family protein [bacterium]|nr:sugar phosphate isomerase/epimerase family protein [bacterium]HPO07709.1 sugar phosphate isomerase/epimerase family protein [bacterium]HQO35888.1 sugar phosphate isomerase/epimerase family protein [bacterium]HQP98641.1 sugar phosphate isomerase/epimerase family protein [bacterium]